MTGPTSLLERLHEATHRVPGVPAHADRRKGHQGRPNRSHRPGLKGRFNHPAKPPRVLVGWQRRIAALVGQWI